MKEKHKKFDPQIKSRYLCERIKRTAFFLIISILLLGAVIPFFVLAEVQTHMYHHWASFWWPTAIAVLCVFGGVFVIALFSALFYSGTKYSRIYPKYSLTLILFPILALILVGIGTYLLLTWWKVDYYAEDFPIEHTLIPVGFISIGGLFFITAYVIYFVAYGKLPNKKAWRNEKKKIKYVGNKELKTDILEASKAGDGERLNALLQELDKQVAQKDAKLAEEQKRAEEAIRIAQQKQQEKLQALGIEPEYDGESKFDGNFWEYIGWKLLGRLVTGITLGIAYPVALCWMERWKAKHTVIKGRRIQFDGNAAELMGHWILWMFLSVITLGIFAFFIPIRLQKWTSLHSHFAGEENVDGEFDGMLLQLIGYRFLGRLITIITLGIAYPMALSMQMRWQTKHTIIAHMRLRFDGNGVQLLGHWILWIFLSIITLGIFAMFIPVRIEKWRVSHIGLSEVID